MYKKLKMDIVRIELLLLFDNVFLFYFKLFEFLRYRAAKFMFILFNSMKRCDSISQKLKKLKIKQKYILIELRGLYSKYAHFLFCIFVNGFTIIYFSCIFSNKHYNIQRRNRNTNGVRILEFCRDEYKIL